MKKEFEILQKLNSHPNIISAFGYVPSAEISVPSKLLDSVKETKKELIVLELCPKGDFFNVIDENHDKINDYPTLKSIFTQICEGVQAIHEETNTAHLDLKLDNILIGQDFKIKICDFGLSQPLKQKQFIKYGTQDYIAPEAYQGAGKTGYEPLKADLFSLGVILFILKFALPPWKAPTLNGDRLYTRFNQDQDTFSRQHPALRKATQQGEKIDEEFLDLIHKLCAHEPQNRPNSVSEVLKHPFLTSGALSQEELAQKLKDL